jgi:2-oxoglutarate ferredoxin oxidoreductase subunit delta
MTVYIEERLCKSCGLCVHFCRRGVLKISDRRNLKGYQVAEVAHPEKCKPCKLCESNCPDFAIYVQSQADAGAE